MFTSLKAYKTSSDVQLGSAMLGEAYLLAVHLGEYDDDDSGDPDIDEHKSHGPYYVSITGTDDFSFSMSYATEVLALAAFTSILQVDDVTFAVIQRVGLAGDA